MLSWLQANIVSVAVAAVLLAIVCLIVRRLILDKKAGRHNCGGSCSSCGCCQSCRKKEKCGVKPEQGSRK